MGAWVIKIYQVENLKKVLLYIEKHGPQEIFELFPFTELIRTHGLDYECLRYQMKVMEKFFNIRKFYHQDCIYFVVCYLLQHLKFLVENKTDVLLPLLEFLRNVYARCRVIKDESNNQIPLNQIGHLLRNLFNSKQEIAVKRGGVLLLIELLMIPEIELPETKIIQSCVSQCFEILDANYPVDLCRLGYAWLGIPDADVPPESKVYSWLKTVCPNLLVQDSETIVLCEIIKCLLQFYITVKREYFMSYMTLSKVYVKKIDVICILMSDPLLRDYCSHLLIYIIRDMCIWGVLPQGTLGDDRFLDELQALKEATNVLALEGDVVFVLIYLHLTYNDSFLVDKSVIANAILKRCHPGKEYTLPTLKALCLLYPMIIEKGEYPVNPLVVKDLLTAMLKSQRFSQLIVYHADQLSWFLFRGNYRLKIYALLLWLLNTKNNDAIILAVIDACSAGQLLVDIVVYSAAHDEFVCNRATELLRRLKNPCLGKILQQNLISSKAMGYVLQANPSFPTDEKEGIFFCKVMSFRLSFLEDKHFFKLGCYYSNRLLTRFKTNPEGVQQFCWNKNCLEQVLRVATCDDDSAATAATKLLRTLFLLQPSSGSLPRPQSVYSSAHQLLTTSRLRLPLPESRQIEASKRHGTQMSECSVIDFKLFLRGSPERLRQTLLFFFTILRSNVPVPIVKFSENSGLGLLHHLFDLETNEQVGAAQFKTLQRLMQVEKHLSNSALAPLFVRAQCLRPMGKAYIGEFLSFLKGWMANLRGYEFYALPFQLFENYLIELRRSPFEGEVNEVLEVLDKWRGFND